MCFFDHFPISAKFDKDICVMSQKTLTVKYLYCTFKFTISKIDRMGNNGKNFRVCTHIPSIKCVVFVFPAYGDSKVDEDVVMGDDVEEDRLFLEACQALRQRPGEEPYRTGLHNGDTRIRDRY